MYSVLVGKEGFSIKDLDISLFNKFSIVQKTGGRVDDDSGYF